MNLCAQLLKSDLYFAAGAGILFGAGIIMFLYHKLAGPFYARKCKCKRGEPEIFTMNTREGVIIARCKACGTLLVPDWKQE